MGEFADMAFDREFNEWLDEGCPPLHLNVPTSTYFRFDEIVHETEKAILFNFGLIQTWLPKSQIEVDNERKIVTIPDWLAITKTFKEGLPEEYRIV